MTERKGLVTFRGNPLTLVGNEVKVGQKAPDFVAIDNNLYLMYNVSSCNHPKLNQREEG